MNKFIYLCGTGDLDKEIINELRKGNKPLAPGKMFPSLHCSLLRNNALMARLDFIEHADEVVVVDGSSPVTRIEVAHAKKNGIPVSYRGINYERLYKAIFEGGN